MVGRSALEREVVEFLDGDDALVRGVPHAVHGTERALAEDAALLVRVEHEHAAQNPSRDGLAAPIFMGVCSFRDLGTGRGEDFERSLKLRCVTSEHLIIVLDKQARGCMHLGHGIRLAHFETLANFLERGSAVEVVEGTVLEESYKHWLRLADHFGHGRAPSLSTVRNAHSAVLPPEMPLGVGAVPDDDFEKGDAKRENVHPLCVRDVPHDLRTTHQRRVMNEHKSYRAQSHA